MKDYTHFLTRDKIIFTTRGNKHPEGFVRAAALYRSSKSGTRKLGSHKFCKDVDEFGTAWVYKINPSYVKNDEFGQRILVPESDIIQCYHPFSKDLQEKNKWLLERSVWSTLLQELTRLVPIEDIGFIGSFLIGISAKESDLDIVIRGKKNLKKIKENFNSLLKELNATNIPADDIIRNSLEKYHKIYTKDENDFLEMIRRRWPTIITKDYMLKIRFAYKEDEVEEVIPRIKQKEVVVEGQVVDDIGTNFMPRSFILKSKDKEYKVETYFWDFTYCVKKGDIVRVKAYLYNDNLLFLYEPKKHGIKFRS